MSDDRPFVRPLSAAAPVLPPRPLIVFDHVCGLCARFVRWVLRHDRRKQFLFTPAQGPLGQAIYADLGLDPTRLETNLIVIDGVAYGKLAGLIEVASRLEGYGGRTALLRLVPPAIGNWAYDRVARNRYALFGRTDSCWTLPDGAADRTI